MLKRYDITTYVNKMHHHFGSPSCKNFEVKLAWPRAISRLVNSYEVSQEAHEWGTKHARKTQVALWEKSSIRKVAITIGIKALTQAEVWPMADEEVEPQKRGDCDIQNLLNQKEGKTW